MQIRDRRLGVPCGTPAKFAADLRHARREAKLRFFAIITTDANEIVAQILDRMPVILAPADYARRLGERPQWEFC